VHKFAALRIEGKWGGKTAGMEGVKKKNERPRRDIADEYYLSTFSVIPEIF
jgi:hypothetical protein